MHNTSTASFVFLAVILCNPRFRAAHTSSPHRIIVTIFIDHYLSLFLSSIRTTVDQFVSVVRQIWQSCRHPHPWRLKLGIPSNTFKISLKQGSISLGTHHDPYTLNRQELTQLKNKI
ncbi:hypothetical protein RND81_03G053800 [Saponaria officinalis]|uniref:Secreted protein n=1 Tax=Saponaria officinalis TaxID=3572 RepID=A0AAW1M1E4_SAPOF